MTVANFVRDIFLKLDKREKDFLGGIPYSKELEREISNYKKYLNLNKFLRKRTRMGDIAYDQSIPVGYMCFTNLNNAKSTNYEKNFIGLNENLNYIHLRQLVIDPEFRNKKIGTNLVNTCLEFADKYKKNVFGDVNMENKKIIYFLKELDFKEYSEWKTPSGTEMIRFLHK